MVHSINTELCNRKEKLISEKTDVTEKDKSYKKGKGTLVMNDFKVEVVRIANVLEHPNADRLEILEIKGMQYKVISAKGNFKANDKAFYFPVDSIIPDIFVKQFGIDKFYKNRIRACKLRGVFSEGLLTHCPSDAKVGDDYTEYFGVKKYETPIPHNMSGEIHSQIEKYKFQAPKNYKNYFHLLQEGEEIIITEKIHGTNFVIRAEKEEFYVGSRNYFWELNSPKNKGNIYIKAFEQFKELQYLPPGVTVYGEIYGVQDLKYGLENGAIDYAIFSVVKNNEYLNYDDFKSFCYIFKLKTAPELYRGQYSKEVVLNFNNKNSVLEPSQIMEGVVISPLYERYDPIIGRVSLKYISDKYLLRKGGTELH